MSAANAALVAYLRKEPGPLKAYVIEHGRPFAPRAIPDRRWRRTATDSHGTRHVHCHASSQRASLDHFGEWEYVEGVAIQRLHDGSLDEPDWHAWNIDATGLVIDTTWDDAAAYFGVVIPRREWSRIVATFGEHGPVLGWLSGEWGDVPMRAAAAGE